MRALDADQPSGCPGEPLTCRKHERLHGLANKRANRPERRIADALAEQLVPKCHTQPRYEMVRNSLHPHVLSQCELTQQAWICRMLRLGVCRTHFGVALGDRRAAGELSIQRHIKQWGF